jgi:hypothetical protein
MLAYGLADTCRSMITGLKQLNRSASSFASDGSQESAASVVPMCVADSISIIAQPVHSA